MCTAPASASTLSSYPGEPITKVFPSLLIVIDSPNAVFSEDPSADIPVNVCTKLNVSDVLPSFVWPCLTNISTFPAVPGDLEDIAIISPLSFAWTICPNLWLLPPSGASITDVCVHVSYVDPSAPTPHL